MDALTRAPMMSTERETDIDCSICYTTTEHTERYQRALRLLQMSYAVSRKRPWFQSQTQCLELELRVQRTRKLSEHRLNRKETLTYSKTNEGEREMGEHKPYEELTESSGHVAPEYHGKPSCAARVPLAAAGQHCCLHILWAAGRRDIVAKLNFCIKN